jgi:predicted RNase H-like HicB family nuclease
MEYTVLIERKQEGWRAFIPALADLGAEGVSRDEAVRNVQRAAEAYLSAVEVTTIKINLLQELARRPGRPQTLLRALVVDFVNPLQVVTTSAHVEHMV